MVLGADFKAKRDAARESLRGVSTEALCDSLRDSVASGEFDFRLARRFALEYVRSYGDPVKAYVKTFGVTRQRAHQAVDAYLKTDRVRVCIADATAPTETIASAGEVLSAVTHELRDAPDSKDRLKAAEILLKVRGHMDRTKREKAKISSATQVVMLVKQYANASSQELEAELIGGGNALREGIEENSTSQERAESVEAAESPQETLDATVEVPGEDTSEYEVSL